MHMHDGLVQLNTTLFITQRWSLLFFSPQLLLMPLIFSKCAGGVVLFFTTIKKLLGCYRYELILNSGDSDNQWCGLESVYQLHN